MKSEQMDRLETARARQLTGIGDLSGSLAERVYQSLSQAILSLAFEPGMVLRKGVICDELGVSRSPVSEAIARLAAEGLVDVIPQSGTRVSRFSMDAIREAAFIREALEVAAVVKVAAGRTPDQVARLARNVHLQQLLKADGDAAGLYEADEDFHALVTEFAGFPGLAAMVSTVSLKLQRPRILLLPEEGRSDSAVSEHEAILEAIRAGDPARAEAAMRFHLGQLVSRLEPLERQYPEYFLPRHRKVPGTEGGPE